MKKLITALAVIAVSAVLAGAAVDADEYRREHAFANRSDGPYQRTDSYGFDWHINGQRLNSATKAIHEDFTEYGDGDVGPATGACMQTDLTTPTANAGDVDVCAMPSGNHVTVYQTTAQTAEIDMDAGSLDIAGDQVNGETQELMLGRPVPLGGKPFVVGDDPAFYTCAKVTVADVSGATELYFGFRKVEAFNATWNNYDTYAVIGSAAGNVTIETEVAGANLTTTDTTEDLADAGTDTYCVYVSAAGVLTYTIDGHAPATTAAATLTDGISVLPVGLVVQSADLSGEIDLLEWEAGYQ